MTSITQLHLDRIKASSASAQLVFRALHIRGWPTVIRLPDNTYRLKHP